MNNIPPLNNGRSSEGDQMAAPPPCLKVFVQRDYSEGTVVKFQTRFPTELEGRVCHSSVKIIFVSKYLYIIFIYRSRGKLLNIQ